MNIGIIGLGKLGLPCAVAMTLKGHNVMGYDVDPSLMSKNARTYREAGIDGTGDFNPLLAESNLQFGSLEQVAEHSELIFIAVQTPHEKEFEGVTRIPDERADFDYSYLESAVSELSKVVKSKTVVTIISTVLPGTFREHVLPHTNEHMDLCYNPYFIAMGTTMRDFLNPEFVLCGVHSQSASEKLIEFYGSIHNAEIFSTTVENAELIKVAYNTFIGMKIVFANTMMEICHKTPNTDVDSVTKALCLGTTRLLSPKYLKGGMGDGGGCHPRDNIALSWLSRKLDLSYDWFESVMIAREKQTEWLADLMLEHDLPKAILGYSFKAETNLTVGSPALLLKNILEERGEKVWTYDPQVESTVPDFKSLDAMVFLIGANHPELKDFPFPKDSVVIDPWRYIPDNPNYKLIKIGSLG